VVTTDRNPNDAYERAVAARTGAACPVCGAVEVFGEQHRVDYHVAAAYHYSVAGLCASDGERWPCRTHVEYAL
jgi:hypothetical protein